MLLETTLPICLHILFLNNIPNTFFLSYFFPSSAVPKITRKKRSQPINILFTCLAMLMKYLHKQK